MLMKHKIEHEYVYCLSTRIFFLFACLDVEVDVDAHVRANRSAHLYACANVEVYQI